MIRRDVLVTGASTTLGRAVAARLRQRPDVRSVIEPEDGDADLAARIDDASIDTIIHAGMCPSRSGTASARPPDVIGTQRLAAAISGRDTSVRAVVALSSSEAYAATSRAPRWRAEHEALSPRPGTDAALVLEAEDYLRALAETQPHISVAILRLADLAGPSTVRSPLTALWDQPVLPVLSGYDPPVNVLHLEDAVTAVVQAATLELAGTVNVASSDTLTWRQAAHLIGRPAVPAAVVPNRLASALHGLRLPCVPVGLVDTLRFGRCVDTSLAAGLGIRPRRTTAEAVRTARAG